MKTTWEKLEGAFEQCHVLSGAARRSFLHELGERDPALFVELQRLLTADNQVAADSFFEPGALHGAGLLEDRFVGKQIGTFTLTELIGEGGMGAVYRAEQTRPFHRLAAIKIIRVNQTNDRLQRRFDVEVQTLARLNHPNIAAVYFSGKTDDGLPYFCMELVEGLSFDAYCRHNKLNVAQRLVLFAGICRAVHFAHQRGVIHRDLKPGNILVTEVDGLPQAKIIDFGIAKAVQDDNQAEHSFQVTATQLTIPGMAVGTLGYMSPEQTLVHGGDVDLRTDVYALGVILYEMLVGDLPIYRQNSQTLSWDQTFKAIREEEPKLPSRAVLQVGDHVAGEMGLTRVALSKRYRGDLDWIITKALEKEPDRRYESAQAFAEDCDRHLANEPVLAGPPSLSYQMGRFVKRNKLLSVSVAVVFTALLVAVIGLGTGFYQAKQAEAEMQQQIETANTTIDVLEEFITSVSPRNEGTEVKVIDRLNEFAPKIDTLNVSDEIRGKLHLLVGRAFDSVGSYTQSIRHFNLAIEINEEIFGEDSNEVFKVKVRLIEAVGNHGDYEKAARMRDLTLDTVAVGMENAKDMAWVNINQAQVYIKRQDFSKAKVLLENAGSIVRDYKIENGTNWAEISNVWGNYYMYKIDNMKSAEHFERALLLNSQGEKNVVSFIYSYMGLATVLNEIGEYSRADDCIKLARFHAENHYGVFHPRSVHPLVRHCHILAERGDYSGVLNMASGNYVGLELGLKDGSIYLSMLTMLAGLAAGESENADIILPFIEAFLYLDPYVKNPSVSKMFQFGAYGTSLYQSGRVEDSLTILNIAYDIARKLGHSWTYLSSTYAYYLSLAYESVQDYNQAYFWACVAEGHFENVQGVYHIKYEDFKYQRVLSHLRVDYSEGERGLDLLIQEYQENYGLEDARTLNLMSYKKKDVID